MPPQPGEVGDTIIHGLILKAFHNVQLGHWGEGCPQPWGHAGLLGEDQRWRLGVAGE